jgi:rubrerythrin
MDEVNAKASEEETPQENPFSAPDEDIAIKEEEEVSSVNPFDRHEEKVEEKVEEEVEEKPKREKAFNFNTIVHKEKVNEVVDEFDSPEVLEIKNKARFCENCGTMITDDMTICPTCGEPIK